MFTKKEILSIIFIMHKPLSLSHTTRQINIYFPLSANLDTACPPPPLYLYSKSCFSNVVVAVVVTKFIAEDSLSNYHHIKKFERTLSLLLSEDNKVVNAMR
jgi:hypothetical protein